MTRAHPESDAQRAILAYIEAVVPNKLVFAIPNAARRSIGGRAGNAVCGLLPGAADLCLCLPEGKVIFFEVKAPNGRISEAQIRFCAKLHGLSHFYYVVRTINDVRLAFDAVGVSTREVP